MPFQSGFIGPSSTPPLLPYHQTNSGVADDTDTHIRYTPQQFGAPDGATIITSNQQYSVAQGLAYVHNVRVDPTGIEFDVFTQAAGGFPFGHHSGDITVSTTFTWALEG